MKVWAIRGFVASKFSPQKQRDHSHVGVGNRSMAIWRELRMAIQWPLVLSSLTKGYGLCMSSSEIGTRREFWRVENGIYQNMYKYEGKNQWRPKIIHLFIIILYRLLSIACMPQATSLINFNHNFAKNSYKQKVKLSVELTLITNFATTLFNVCLIFSLANN